MENLNLYQERVYYYKNSFKSVSADFDALNWNKYYLPIEAWKYLGENINNVPIKISVEINIPLGLTI